MSLYPCFHSAHHTLFSLYFYHVYMEHHRLANFCICSRYNSLVGETTIFFSALRGLPK